MAKHFALVVAIGVLASTGASDDLPCIQLTDECLEVYKKPETLTSFESYFVDQTLARYATCVDQKGNHSSTVCVIDTMVGTQLLIGSTLCLPEKFPECFPPGSYSVGELAALSNNGLPNSNTQDYMKKCKIDPNKKVHFGNLSIPVDLVIAETSYKISNGVDKELGPEGAFVMNCGDHEQPIDTGAIIIILVSALFFLMAVLSEFLEGSFNPFEDDTDAMSNAQTAINTAYEDNDADSSGLIAKVDNRLVKRKGIRKIAYLWNPTNNVKKLLESSAKRSLQGLDGLRAFSMMWIIMAHSALLPGEIGYDNPTAVIERFTEESAMFPVGANLGVDTFFFIAGVLTAYTSIKGMRKQMIAMYKIPKQLAFFTLLRWLRLFPVYAYLMALYTFVFPLIGSGPFWFHMKSQVGLCKQYWWTNLLFINNFHPVSFYDNCMSWTWYLANYMQFSIIAMITLYVYIRSPTAGKVLALGLTIGLTILGFFLIDKNAYDSAKFQDAYYDKPYTRYPALSFGVYIGMILRDTPPKDLKLSQMTSFLVRHCSVGVILFTIYIFGYEYDRQDSIKGKLTQGWTVQELAAYDTFGRMAFVIGIAGLTYLCTVGGAGIYGKFLDLPFWEPFGKLTFGAYLVHPAIIRIFAFNGKTYFDQEPLNEGLNFLGIAVLAYSSAFLTYIAIELPFESMLMGLKGKKK